VPEPSDVYAPNQELEVNVQFTATVKGIEFSAISLTLVPSILFEDTVVVACIVPLEDVCVATFVLFSDDEVVTAMGETRLIRFETPTKVPAATIPKTMAAARSRKNFFAMLSFLGSVGGVGGVW
jgi:hypothetical protein